MTNLKALSRTACIAVLAIASTAFADSLPLISIDSNHKELVKVVSSEDFSTAMAQLVSTVNDSTLSALERQSHSLAPKNFAESGSKTVWMLRDVLVGVSTSLSVGLGPVWSVSFTPKMQFGFSNSTHPKYSD